MSDADNWCKRSGVADGLVVGKGPERQRRVMELLLIRGISFKAADDAAAGAGRGGCPVMDAAVWGKLPEELIWEVLSFVPAAKLFQLHLVSRKWRQVLTSAHFRRRLITQSAKQSAKQQEPLVALVSDIGSASDGGSRHAKALEVDLSMVPCWFWDPKWDHTYYTMMAAAHGLVCICNGFQDRGWGSDPWTNSNRYCVLNLLTRTCIVLPDLPFQVDKWLLPNSTTVVIWGVTGEAWPNTDTAWRAATYDLASGNGCAGWVSAHAPVPRLPYESSLWPPERVLRLAYVPKLWPPLRAVLGAETYCYTSHDNLVHVMATDEVELGTLDAPSVTLLGLDQDSLWVTETYQQSVLMAHRGALYFVAQLATKPPLDLVCGVWRLAPAASGRMEWEGVARLDAPKLEQLTGLKCVQLRDAYAVRELVCIELVALAVQEEYWVDLTFDSVSAACLLDFNLDKGKWELVYCDEELEDKDLDGEGLMDKVMELRPDLFLSW